jgi:hypothetical protein
MFKAVWWAHCADGRHRTSISEDPSPSEAWTKEVRHKVPLVRDVDISYYLRQDNGLNLMAIGGNYAGLGDAGRSMPDDFSFLLYPDDLDLTEFPSKTRWRVCRCWLRLALAAISTARSHMRPMVCRWSGRCPV